MSGHKNMVEVAASDLITGEREMRNREREIYGGSSRKADEELRFAALDSSNY